MIYGNAIIWSTTIEFWIAWDDDWEYKENYRLKVTFPRIRPYQSLQGS